MGRVLLAIFLSLLIAGCDMDDFVQQPHVTSVNPENKSENVESDTTVQVQFSKEMDKAKTNEAFSLSADDSGDIDGFFSWSEDGKTMTFTPREGLTSTQRYTIRVSTDAEDNEGSDLEEELVSTFSLTDDVQSPVLESYTPIQDSTGNSKDIPVILTFSEPIDVNTIYDGVEISPAVQGYFSWNSDRTTFTFTPLYGYNYGVTYAVTVNESIRDSNGITLKEDVNFNFTVGDDFEKPEISRIYQDLSVDVDLDENLIISGCEKDASIVIEFSEVVEKDTIESAISFSPSIEFYITESAVSGCSMARINFTENLQSEEIYTLNISDSILDLQNNELTGEYRFRFITDGINSLRPDVDKIGDVANPNWTFGVVQTLTYSDTLHENISVTFTKPVNPLTLSLNVTTVAGIGISPEVVNIGWNSDKTVLTFGLDGVTKENIYKIILRGGSSGIQDSNENFMEEDFVQLIEF